MERGIGHAEVVNLRGFLACGVGACVEADDTGDKDIAAFEAFNAIFHPGKAHTDGLLRLGVIC